MILMLLKVTHFSYMLKFTFSMEMVDLDKLSEERNAILFKKYAKMSLKLFVNVVLILCQWFN